jgi:UDP-2,4-diacetamido-2,4,6-trideoxy-beta-L-altropyranose hydrolase
MGGLKGGRLVIRADASVEIGTGHLMRCLALGQAWKDAGGQVTFVTNCSSEGLLRRLRAEEFDVTPLQTSYPDPGDWQLTLEALKAHPRCWVAIDGYHFDDGYQQRVKESGHKLLVIDDMAHLKHYCADVVLNQNIDAEQLRYPCEPYTSLLLGTRYVLLRREFLSWTGWKRQIPELGRHVLVTLGGSDSQNYTAKVIEALQSVGIPGLEATVVVGASNPNMASLKAAVRHSRVAIRLLRDAENMPDLMAWADVVVSGAGTTVWELMYMGVPSLLIVIADNQARIARSTAASGAAVVITDQAAHLTAELATRLNALMTDARIRSQLSREGKRLVDGVGVIRVLDALNVPARGGGNRE